MLANSLTVDPDKRYEPKWPKGKNNAQPQDSLSSNDKKPHCITTTTYLQGSLRIPLSVTKISFFSKSGAQLSVLGVCGRVQLELSRESGIGKLGQKPEPIFQSVVVAWKPDLFVLLKTDFVENFLKKTCSRHFWDSLCFFLSFFFINFLNLCVVQKCFWYSKTFQLIEIQY
jgi:hypothetical protein